MRFKGFVGPAYTLKTVNADAQACVNLYPELNEIGTGKEAEVAYLRGTPGLTSLVTPISGEVRLIHVDPQNRVFAAVGNKMYKLTYAAGVWSSTLLGTLSTSTGPIKAASTLVVAETATVFVDGTDTYLFWYYGVATGDFGNFASFGYSSVANATHVVFIDGYFVFTNGTNQFYTTDLNSFTVSPLSFASAEGDPDSIVSMITNHRDLILINEDSCEIFVNTGNADFPFERVSGGFIEKGCAAPYSVAKIDGIVSWLGRDHTGQGIVYAAISMQPQRISTHAIETAIQSYADLTTATAYTYSSGGHSFYVLNFDEATWVYDFSTKLWHQRAYTNAGALERHRSACHAFVPEYGIHMVGDYATGKIYQLDDDVYDDAGDAITRLRTAPHVTSGLKKLFYKSLQLDMESGVGLASGQGSDPQVILDWSDDGGHTWSDETWTSAGGQVGGVGQYKTRVIWRRLGSSRDRVFRVKITDPVKVAILGAELDVEVGVS